MKKYQILKGGRASLKTTRHATRIVIDSILLPGLISFVVAKESSKLDTGLYSEFNKVIGRVTNNSYVEGKGKDYWAKKSPLCIEFSNGSKIHFSGSKNSLGIKGRSISNDKERFGYIFFDEFADYAEADGMPLLEALIPTFVRDDYAGHFNHYFWKPTDLDLDKPLFKENGEPELYEDIDGNVKQKIHIGQHTMGAKFLFAWNPPDDKYHWSFDFVEKMTNRPDTLIQHVNYTDVQKELMSMGQHAVIAEAENTRLYDNTKYMHQWLGLPVSSSGLFFKSFDPNKSRASINTEFDKSKISIGVDFGAANATTFVAIGLTPTNDKIALALYYHSNREASDGDNERGSTKYAQDLYDFTLALKKKYDIKISRPIPTYVDPSARGFINDVKYTMKLKGHYPMKVIKAYNDRANTLANMQDIIAKNEFKYIYPQPAADKLEFEISRCQINDRGDDIIKEDDHLIDALRYALWKQKKETNRHLPNLSRFGVNL
jgi:PBSX family phage terminase large subunit